MDEENIKKSIIILALDNLVYTYKSALEYNLETGMDIEEMNFIMDLAQDIIKEMGRDLKQPEKTISKPQWKKH